MKTLKRYLALGLFLTGASVFPLDAQTANAPPAANNKAGAARTSTAAGQAPDVVMQKLSDLINDRKYGDAQRMAGGLLAAYPDDQRLIKAKALLDRLLAPVGSSNPAPAGNPAAGNSVPAIANALTGMEKVDYEALLELARQAQVTADLAQQKKLLQQFMDESAGFLQRHPDQMVLWQFRAVSALSLGEPMAGYEAAQKILAQGDTDRDDDLRRLLAQLKNKGWLDQKEAERQAKYGWLVGSWSLACTETDGGGSVVQRCDPGGIEFDKAGSSESLVDGYRVRGDGAKSGNPSFRVTILDSGEISCEQNNGISPPKWVPVLSCKTSDNNTSLTIKSAARYKNDEGNIWTSSMHKN